MAGSFRPQRGKAWHQQRKVVPAEERTGADGIKHRTRSELKRWNELNMLVAAGTVRNLRREVKYELATPDGEIVVTSRKGNVRSYTADFVYEKWETAPRPDPTIEQREMFASDDAPQGRWVEIVEDVKGFLDPAQELRINVFEALTGKRVYLSKAK